MFVDSIVDNHTVSCNVILKKGIYMTEEYKRYMRSREWNATRQQRLDIDEHCCAMCGRPEAKCRNGLQVHHITYQRLGHEDIYNDLVSLCAGCHKKIHSYYRRKRHGYEH